MGNINYLLDDYMHNKGIFLNNIEYAQSEKCVVTKENAIDLLLKPAEELPVTETRFTSYGEGGRAYEVDITTEHLNKQLPHYLTEEPKHHSFAPLNMETVIDLIDIIQKKKHYRVFGYNQDQFDSWTLDLDVVCSELAKTDSSQIDDIDPVSLFEEKDNKLFTSDGELAMIKNTEHPFNMVHREMEFFDIVDTNGEIVFEKMEYESLGIVLSCLYFDMDEEAIKYLFLRLKGYDDKPISYDYIAYNRATTSDRLWIRKKYDLLKIHRLEINEEAKVDGHYIVFNEQATAFSEKIIRKNEIFDLPIIFSDEEEAPKEYKDALANLWDQLIDVMTSFDLSLYHFDRLKIGEWFMEQIEYKDGQVQNFVRLLRKLDGQSEYGTHPTTACFTLVDNQTSEEVLLETNLYTLMTQLISLKLQEK